MGRSRTISIAVEKKTGDAFDAILKIPPKMMPDAIIDDSGWWSFTTWYINHLILRAILFVIFGSVVKLTYR